MGLSASQARLLSITARLSQNEMESQLISNSKMRLANKTQAASDEYVRALNNAKMVYTTYDAKGNVQQSDLTPAIIYEYSDLKNQYGISNASGELLVNQLDATNFENSSNISEFLQCYGINPIEPTIDLENIPSAVEGSGNQFSLTSLMNYYSSATYNSIVPSYSTAINETSMAMTLCDIEKNLATLVWALTDSDATSITSTSGITINRPNPTDISLVTTKPQQIYLTIEKTPILDYTQYKPFEAGTNADGESVLWLPENWCIETTYDNSGNKNGKAFVLYNNSSASTRRSYYDIETGYASFQCKIRSNVSGRNFKEMDHAIKIEQYVDPNDPNNPNSPECITRQDGTKLYIKYDPYEKRYFLIENDGTTPVTPATSMVYNYSYLHNGSTATGTDTYKFNNEFDEDVIIKNDNKCYDAWGSEISISGEKIELPIDLDGNPIYDKDITIQTDSDGKIINEELRTLVEFLQDKIGPNNYSCCNSWYQNLIDLYAEVLAYLKTNINNSDFNDRIPNCGNTDKYYNNVFGTNRNTTNKTAVELRTEFKNLYDNFGLLGQKIITENGTKIGKKDPSSQWYTNLWVRMNGGSITKNTSNKKYYKVLDENLYKSKEWMQFALQHGVITFEKVQFKENVETGYDLENLHWDSIIYTNCADITEVDDEVAIAKAEAKYTQALHEIQAKEKKYDNDIKKLDTEHTAIQTEYDSIKEVLSKNVERSYSKTFNG